MNASIQYEPRSITETEAKEIEATPEYAAFVENAAPRYVYVCHHFSWFQFGTRNFKAFEVIFTLVSGLVDSLKPGLSVHLSSFTT